MKKAILDNPPTHKFLEALGCASTWWIEQIIKPTFDNGANQTKDSNELLAILARLKNPPLKVSKRLFKEVFTELVLKAITPNTESIMLSVDYNPDALLSEIAKRANINLDLLLTYPWKSYTLISPDKVIVKLGYTGAQTEIFNKSKNIFYPGLDPVIDKDLTI